MINGVKFILSAEDLTEENVPLSKLASRAIFELHERNRAHNNRNCHQPPKKPTKPLEMQAIWSIFIAEAKLILGAMNPIFLARTRSLTGEQVRLARFMMEGVSDSEIALKLGLKHNAYVIQRKERLGEILDPGGAASGGANRTSIITRLRKASELGLLPRLTL